MIRTWINPGVPAVGLPFVQLGDRRLPGGDLGEKALIGGIGELEDPPGW